MSSRRDAQRPHVALFLKNERGGVAGRRVHLAEALLRRGCRVDVVTVWLRHGTDGIPAGVRVIQLAPALRNWPVIPGHYAAVPALARYLRRERPDVILSATTPLNVAAVSAKCLSRAPVRLVISQHNPVSETIAFRQYRSAPVMAHLVRKFYPAADAVVAVSTGIADDLKNAIGLNGATVSIIHNPVITDGIAPLREARVEHPWFADGGPPVVIGVGRLTPQKGFDDLIRAFALVRARRDARLVILGSGRDHPQLIELVHGLGLDGVVDLPGWVPNPHAYMARADLFVLSSRYEGFGNVLVEALACGCPIVATNCVGGPADILEGGRFGRLVPVGALEAMAEAILEALDAPADVDALRRRAMDFHVDRIVERYCEVLGV
jgi:glycosyltransferase involved in cell wall biosynthesis